MCLKYLFYALALFVLFPLICLEIGARRVAGHDVFFNAHAQLLSILPGKWGWYFRNVYYRFVLRRCPLNCAFLFGAVVTHSEAEVGKNVLVGINSVVGHAVIGDWTMLAEGVHLISGKRQHGTRDASLPFQLQPGTYDTVHIGRNCWIGANAVVMSDIGDNCIVGAGAVVTRSFPSNKVIAGNPARVVGDTFGRRLDRAADTLETTTVSGDYDA